MNIETRYCGLRNVIVSPAPNEIHIPMQSEEEDISSDDCSIYMSVSHPLSLVVVGS